MGLTSPHASMLVNPSTPMGAQIWQKKAPALLQGGSKVFQVGT